MSLTASAQQHAVHDITLSQSGVVVCTVLTVKSTVLAACSKGGSAAVTCIEALQLPRQTHQKYRTLQAVSSVFTASDAHLCGARG
jgi:hypothetical protein